MTKRCEGYGFKKATPEDEQYLGSLYQSAFDIYVRSLGRERSDGPYDWLSSAIEKGHIWVATRGNEIVGAVTLVPEGDNCLVDAIAVSPQLQGKGIGSWILQNVEELARRQGIKKLSLCTAKIRSDLVRLYERFGFAVVREALPEHKKDTHMRVFMEKIL